MTADNKQTIAHIIFSDALSPGVHLKSTFFIEKNNKGNAVITFDHIDFRNNYSRQKCVLLIKNDEQINELRDAIREFFTEFVLDDRFITKLTDSESVLAIRKQAACLSVLLHDGTDSTVALYIDTAASVIFRLKKLNKDFLSEV